MRSGPGASVPRIPDLDSGADVAWHAVLAAAREADRLEQAGQPAAFALGSGEALLRVAPGDPAAVFAWRPGAGWQSLLPPTDARHVIFDLYLPLCGATITRPMTFGHLGQSLDGFIATHEGDSQFVTGPENIVHLHRLRALCDADIVGAGTVAADDPQLTTRFVTGPSPLRVVFDPARRLAPHYRVFNDDSASTLYVCANSLVRPGETHVGRATLVPIADTKGDHDVIELQRVLRDRGCRRILVEGGGVTVSKFLKANLLDRLQVAVAPFIIGDGRPAIRLPGPALLSDCERPRHRVFRMGDDVLFELVIRDS
jgi:diaminohydroxyphosphoribosylaminopyrimidine deaminase / 5-amino-6-(5-phosphoribosylamino)uracil reductase